MDSTQRLELLDVLDHVLSYSSKSKPSLRKKPSAKKSINSSSSYEESNRDNQLKIHKAPRNKADQSLLPRNENTIGNGFNECEDSVSAMELLDILSAGNVGRRKKQNGRVSEPRSAKAKKASETLIDDMLKRTPSYHSTSNYSDLETSFQSPILESEKRRMGSGLKAEVPEEHWESLLHENSEDFRWTSHLDETLLELAYEFDCDWKRVMKCFPEENASVKVLKDRYKILKDISLPNKARFTPQEDRKIVRYYKKYGMNWAAISSMLPGRGAITVKNRFYSSLRYKLEKEEEENFSTQEKTMIAEPSLSISKTCSTSMNIEEEEEEVEAKIEQEEGEKNYFFEIDHKYDEYDCDHFFSFQDMKQGDHFEFDMNLDQLNNGSENHEVIQQQEHPATVQGLNNKINLLMSLYSQICQDLNSTKNKVC